ncbi:glycosyltransferase family 4 protein [Dermabacteraceae bacterium TAE3-ERU27]|nr:glycosyltransferase family 4 protein [Dermabacteraceae bacterium TAE3-ERU27]
MVKPVSKSSKKVVIYHPYYGINGGITSVMKLLDKELRKRGITPSHISGNPALKPAPKDTTLFEANKYQEYTIYNKLARKYPGPLGIKYALKLAFTPIWLAIREVRILLHFRKYDTDTVILVPTVFNPNSICKPLRKIFKSTSNRPNKFNVITQFHNSWECYSACVDQRGYIREMAESGKPFGTLSRFDASRFSEEFKIPVFYIENLIEVPSRSKSPSLNNKKIGFIARLSTEKRLPLIIEAFSLSIKKYPDWSLHVYGTGPDEDRCRKIAQEKLPEGSYSFHGWASNREKIFSDLDVSILASEYEGQPMSMLESASYGIPIIATPASAKTREIAEACGFLCKEDTPEAISETMNKVFNSKDLLREKSTDCLNYISSYPSEGIINTWLELLKNPHSPAVPYSYPPTTAASPGTPSA